MLRRNVGSKVLLFNNKIYGLTKGQLLADLELNKEGEIDAHLDRWNRPFNPVSLAIGSEATFVARSVDVFQGHLKETLKHAAAHKGRPTWNFADCNIFTTARVFATEPRRSQRDVLQLETASPVSARPRQEVSAGNRTATSKSCNSASESPSLICRHDAHHPRPAYAFQLSHMEHRPDSASPIGVFRAWATCHATKT